MGQLGNDSTIDSSVPVLVRGLEGIKIDSVVSGSLHTCAYENKGRAWCWGSNRDGKLGAGIEAVFSPIPVLVLEPVDQVISLSAGATFTCAVGGTGQTWCWGDGSSGQTGTKYIKVVHYRKRSQKIFQKLTNYPPAGSIPVH